MRRCVHKYIMLLSFGKDQVPSICDYHRGLLAFVPFYTAHGLAMRPQRTCTLRTLLATVLLCNQNSPNTNFNDKSDYNQDVDSFDVNTVSPVHVRCCLMARPCAV